MILDTDPRHGTASFYQNHGCRCRPCKDAWAARVRRRRAAARKKKETT